jgi:hypothetical protein
MDRHGPRLIRGAAAAGVSIFLAVGAAFAPVGTPASGATPTAEPTHSYGGGGDGSRGGGNG